MQSSSRKHFFISCLLHAIILMSFIVSFELSSHNFVLQNADKNELVMNAVVLSDSKMQMPDPTPLPTLTKAPVAPKKIAPPPPPPPKPVVKPEPPVKEIVKPKPEAIVIPDAHKKKIAQELREKQLLADLKKQTLDQKKQQKQTELEKAFAKELKAQSAKALQQDLLKEQARAATGQAQKMQGIVDKYKALILQSISQHWLVPNGVNPSLSSQLLIRIAPGGVVLDVQVVKSSGDEALDRSARAAVFKASPLPVPNNADEFEPFRQFTLKVKPENVLTRDSDLK